jgi:hypothetical protein
VISKWVWPHCAVDTSTAVLMGENCSTFNKQGKQSKAAIDDEDIIHGGMQDGLIPRSNKQTWSKIHMLLQNGFGPIMALV